MCFVWWSVDNNETIAERVNGAALQEKNGGVVMVAFTPGFISCVSGSRVGIPEVAGKQFGLCEDRSLTSVPL